MAFMDELKESMRRNKDIAAVFRIAMPGSSELLLVTNKDDKKKKDRITKTVLAILKKYPIVIKLDATDLNTLKNDPAACEKIIRKAELISGEMPDITIKQLNLKPFVIISYALTNLSQKQKMQLKRGLYGKKTTKKYKGKVYESSKDGALKQAKGRKLGKGSIMIPQAAADTIIQVLRSNSVAFEITDIWL